MANLRPVTALDDPLAADFVALNDPERRRRVERAGDYFVVEGLLAIERLLDLGTWAIRSLLLLPRAAERLADRLDALDVPVGVATPDVLRAVVGFDLHRGALASVARQPPADLTALVTAATRPAADSADGTPADLPDDRPDNAPVDLAGDPPGARSDGAPGDLPGEPADLPDGAPGGSAGARAAGPTCRPLLLALEGVNDHENLGALYRNAAGFGVAGVVLDPRCADPFYRRSVRVSLGHVLAVPTARGDGFPGDLHRLHRLGVDTVALTPAADLDLWGLRDRLPPDRPVAVLVGAEGPGLTAGALAGATWRVGIPMTAGVDSLNVATAAAIALHHLR